MKKIIIGILLIWAWTFSNGCSSKQNGEKEPTNDAVKVAESPAEVGRIISSAAQQRLGKQLVSAIEKGGYAHAVSYCRVKAKPITDSVAREYDATVRRVSDKTRNPRNAANDREMEYIAYYRNALKNEGDWSGKLVDNSDSYTYYAPIITNPLCLNCHGDPEKDIARETITRISNDYPQDRAVGYASGELRGLWKVEWNKE